MTEGAIIGLTEWLKTPAGEYLLAWEQRHLDQAVADVFGFHALQLGLPELDALRANRMPHRWVAVESPPLSAEARRRGRDAEPERRAAARPRSRCTATSTRCRSTAASLDLVVLPHALELARDPHLTLREVERVLVPEGRVVIVGFNPASLWGTAAAPRAHAAAAWAWAPSATCSCRAPASSSATGACATGCACSASRSRRAASAATARR